MAAIMLDELYDELRGEAEVVYDGATRRARGASKQARQQVHVVSGAIKENPGTAAVLSAAGIVGFLIGLLAGRHRQPPVQAGALSEWLEDSSAASAMTCRSG